MAMVDVDDSSLPTGGLTAQFDWLGLRVGSHLALRHDDSTINIVVVIIIIIIITVLFRLT